MISMKKPKGIVQRFKQMLKSDRGNISMVFGMSLPMLVMAMGSAVDYQRAVQAKHGLQESLDAATMFAAQLSDKDDAVLKQKTQSYLDLNFKHDGTITVSKYTPHNAGDNIFSTAEISVKTNFMNIMGINALVANAESKVFKSGINLEVSLILDNTGSMNSTNPATGNTAISDLKTAAKKFVDIVMPTTQGQFYTKIAAIPFNNSVNVGTRANSIRGPILSGTGTVPGYQNYTFTNEYGNSQTMPITNCVTERVGNHAYDDSLIGIINNVPLWVGSAYLNSNNPCQVKELIPLSTDGTALKTRIDQMTAGSSTAVQVGIGWGWYTLSPNVGIWSGSEQPAGYDKLTTTNKMEKVKKIMVLMTDAESNSAYVNGVITGNPTVYGSGGGNDHINMSPTNGNSYTQAASMCNAIKASGVEVYVITFQLNHSYPQRVQLVNNCATDASHILDADAGGLDTAFSTIANAIMDLRLAQ
jgi:Flp pilus assembly protein TadG